MAQKSEKSVKSQIIGRHFLTFNESELNGYVESFQIIFLQLVFCRNLDIS